MDEIDNVGITSTNKGSVSFSLDISGPKKVDVVYNQNLEVVENIKQLEIYLI